MNTARVLAKIDKELAIKNYSGYGSESGFLQMDWKQFGNYCAGELICSIGRGDFRSEVNGVLRLACAWEQYNGARNILKKKYGID